MPLKALFIFCFIAIFSAQAMAQHKVLVQGNDRLAIVNDGGDIAWEMEWGGIHDIHYLENGKSF